jgi:signal transduction histidine kinase
VILAGRTAQHELNNRLARVVGYSELLTIDTGMTDEARLMAERVLAAAKETVETVERMSRVTRIEELDWGERIGGTIDLARSTEAPPPAEVA